MSLAIIDELIELSKEKKLELKDLLGLTRVQSDLITREDLDSLGENIGKKEELMSKIDRLDLDYLDKFSSLKLKEGVKDLGELDPLKYPSLKDLRDITLELKALIGEIRDLDEKNRQAFSDQFGEVKSQLKNVKNVKTAYKGYNVQSSASMLIDERK